MAGGILHDAWCSPVGLPIVSQVGLEPVSGSLTALLFSHCNVAWVQSVKVLILLAALFLLSVTPVSQRGFGVMELTLLLHPSHHLVSLPCFSY
jgi:hypothetical protein